MEIDLASIAFLGGIALLAGFVDAIAGGGGLLTLPMLLLAGLDPVAANATNKAQSIWGSASATIAYARAGRIDWRGVWPMALASFLASMAGASVVALISTAALKVLMPLLLIAMALYFALSRRIADVDAKARLGAVGFTLSAVIAVGFYDGVLGPGAGSLFTLGFVTLLGYGVTRATAHTKVLNFASNAGGLVLLGLTGHVVWLLGLVMGLCQFCGAQLGAHMAVRHGARLIRPLLVIVCCAVAGRLLLDSSNPIRVWLAGL